MSRGIVCTAVVMLAVAMAGPAGAYEMPRGVSLSNQVEYAWSTESEDAALEEWMDVRYASGALSGGLRFTAFQPPDSTQSRDPSSFNTSFRFLEATSDIGRVRAGHYYALFGQGLVLNAYEQRDLRIDTNLEGLMTSGSYGGATLTLLSGTTVTGNLEDDERRRADRLHGADAEWSWWQTGLTIGGSAVEMRRYDSARLREKSNHDVFGVRGGLTRGALYLYGEGAWLKQPEPRADGRGYYASANLGLGPVQLLAEYKDYEDFWLLASGGVQYNLPPAVIREHTYTLLNRHPHQLNADDEKGFQAEGTLTIPGEHQLTAHVARARNQNEDETSSYFDEAYGELLLNAGPVSGVEDVDIVGAFDYQKSFSDEFAVELWTSIAEFRIIHDERNSFRVQTEYQHLDSESEGKYNTLFGLIDWSRSPGFSVTLVGETSDRSDLQLEIAGQEGEAVTGVYGLLSVNLSQNHDVSVMYGRRLAGFVCAGGVCRFEPEFEGVEVRLFSRF